MENLKIDSEFWQLRVKKAIKKYPNRAIDIFHCFSPSQEESKRWLLECVNEFTRDRKHKVLDIAILGSWYGYLAYLIRDMLENKMITEIRCYDIDSIAKNIGRVLFYDTVFKFETKDISTMNFREYRYNMVINTSSEHMSDDTLHKWLFTSRKNTICVLQSTDKPARDHINLVNSEKELDEKFKDYFSDYKTYSYNFGSYSRFMIIGTIK